MEQNASALFPNEKLWLTILSASGELRYAITTPSEYDRREYFLYDVSQLGRQPKLLGKGPNPTELEAKYAKIC